MKTYLRIEQNVLPWTKDFFFLPEEEARQLYLNGKLDYYPESQAFRTNSSTAPLRSANFVRSVEKLRGELILTRYFEELPNGINCGCPSVRACRNKKACVMFALYQLDLEDTDPDLEADELEQFLDTLEKKL